MIEHSRHQDIHELRLARPPVNALDPALCRRLRDGVAEALAEGAQGLVLSGGAGVFSAGLDVPYLLGLERADEVRYAMSGFIDAARVLAQSPVPVVAALDGHAPAGGCVLALCCDYRVMAEGDFRIGLNETQVGLVAPEGIQRLMRRVVGPHRAERLLVGGEMVDAQRALAIGLVDELAPAEDVPQRAHAWLARLLALPARPVLATRAIARAEVVEALRPELLDLDNFIASWTEPDTQAALKALVVRLGK